MCFLFLIRSPPATNIFVQNLMLPHACAYKVTAIFNVENIFNNLKYIAYYCISSTFTRILSEYHLSFQFVVKLEIGHIRSTCMVVRSFFQLGFKFLRIVSSTSTVDRHLVFNFRFPFNLVSDFIITFNILIFKIK